MNIDYPYHFDSRGRTAEASGDDHIRDMIEQVLFTSPGERANRPTFGSGLLQMVFAPINDALSGVVQMSVQGALQQWLGDLIRVEGVQVESEESTVRVLVQYTVLKTQQRQIAQFERGAG
jgi:phage baseplate assembly protein W